MKNRWIYLALSLLLTCGFTSGFCIDPTNYEGPRSNDPSTITANDLVMLDNLIEATQKSIENQKILRQQIKDYQKLQLQYLNNSQDNELLYRMVKSAYAISNTIKENHLTQAFSPEFMSEINLFAQVASKRGIPRP